jgi:hypothetical protein
MLLAAAQNVSAQAPGEPFIPRPPEAGVSVIPYPDNGSSGAISVPPAQSQPGQNPSPSPEPVSPPPSPEPPRPAYRASYGSVSYSVLFSDDTMQQVRNALDQAERAIAEGRSPVAPSVVATPGATEPVVASAAPPPPQLQFPVFHVASIAYRSPKDWMLWINGQRATPKRPFVGIEVVGVVKDRVTLRWVPDNWEYRALIWKADTEMPPALKRLRSRDGVTRIDTKAKALIATLKSNQTLVTSVPLVAEGRHMNLNASIQAQPLPNDSNAEAAAQNVQEELGRAAQEKTEEIKEKARLEAEAELQRQQAPPPPQPPTPNVPPGTTNPHGLNTPQDTVPPSLNDVLNEASQPPRRSGY